MSYLERLLTVDPEGIFMFSERVNGERNPLHYERPLRCHFHVFANAVNRTFDVLALYDAYLPYWAQPYLVIILLTYWWAFALSKFIDVYALTNRLVKINQGADRLISKANAKKNQ